MKKDQPQSILELVIFLLAEGYTESFLEAVEMLGLKD